MGVKRDNQGRFAGGGGGTGGGNGVKGAAKKATAKPGAKGPTNSAKVANAATMYGTGSKQHLAAIKRFG